MGKAEPGRAAATRREAARFYSLSRDGDSGTCCPRRSHPPRMECFYSLSRDGDSGTRAVILTAELAAVSIRCREMGTAERVLQPRRARLDSGFYSLSRDGDSGTRRSRAGRVAGPAGFLFAVARWGQRNTARWLGCGRRPSFYSLSRDGDSGTTRDRGRDDP